MIIDFGLFTILIAAILLSFILMFLKIKKKKSYPFLIFFCVFYIYLCFVLKYTEFPIYLNNDMRKAIGQNVWQNMNFIPFKGAECKTSLLNILLTIPFGFGYPFITKSSWKKSLALGFSVGCAIELLQFTTAILVGFTFRCIDINDVIFNCTGLLVGYGISCLFFVIYKKLFMKKELEHNKFLLYIYNLK